MTGDELRAAMQRMNLREVDVAWLMGVSVRHVRRWKTNVNPVPQTVHLLLQALEQGKLRPNWFKKHIVAPVPWSATEYEAYLKTAPRTGYRRRGGRPAKA